MVLLSSFKHNNNNNIIVLKIFESKKHLLQRLFTAAIRQAQVLSKCITQLHLGFLYPVNYHSFWLFSGSMHVESIASHTMPVVWTLSHMVWKTTSKKRTYEQITMHIVICIILPDI